MNDRNETTPRRRLSYLRSIRARIMLGFMTLIVGIVLMSAVSYSGFSTINQEFDTFRNLNQRATNVLELDRRVSEVQRYVSIFSYTGHDSVADRTLAVVGSIKEQLVAIRSLLNNPRDVERVDRLNGHLKTYRDTFSQAYEQRKLRKVLEEQDYPRVRRQVEEALQNYRNATGRNERLGERTFVEVKELEENLFAYMLQLEAYPLEQSLENLKVLQRELSKDKRPQAAFLHQALDGLHRLAIRIMQATRSFLYLTGVVMAGEALEFSHVSTSLRESILAEMNPVIGHIQTNTEQTQTFNLVFSLMCIVFGLIFSMAVGLSIARPIQAVAGTLLKLSRGEKTVIPGTERTDEIGMMAQAAGVFAKRNEETEQLLTRAQILTRELDLSKKELERSNNEMEQFVYTVSHDLKSPVVTSMGFIGMMKVFAEQGNAEEALNKLPTLEKANQRMSELINDLLDLSRVGRADAEHEFLNMDEILENVQLHATGLLEKYPADLTISKNLPNIRGNETRVAQVFDNLISNALKYTSLTPSPTIQIGGFHHEQGIRFFVKDNGPGIPKRHHDRVFGLFQRLDVSIEGTGIGLAIVKKVMKTHNGSVWIESEGDGGGCTFWLQFPAYGDKADANLHEAAHEGN